MEFKIFGCKVNKYYTDKWLNSEQLAGKTGIFIASCVVTDNAKRKWLKFVKDTIKWWKITWERKVYISWCWAFKSGKAQEDFFEIYPELDNYKDIIVILWEDPDELKIDQTHTNLNQREKREVSKDTPQPSRAVSQGTSSWANSSSSAFQKWAKLEKLKNITGIYTKKFVLIQWGCDSFCTFCLTVQKRGRHFFRSADDIVEEILEFELTWWKEVVLTWVNLSAWGLDTTEPVAKAQLNSSLSWEDETNTPFSSQEKDWDWGVNHSRFAELLQIILDKTDIKRIRISSLGPEFITDECLEIFKNTRIYPHFHYSVQSLSSSVLQSMKRHYDGKYMKELLLKTKNLKRDDGVDISLWADIIVWFPGETDEHFSETYEAIQEIWIQKIHAFPFSWHEMWETVPAWFFKDQVPPLEKKERMKKITELCDTIRADFIKSQRWKKLEVLIEVAKDGKFKWWTQNYIEATQDNFKIESWKIEKNQIIQWELF